MCTSESPPCPFFAAHCHSARSYYRSVFACVGRRFHGPRHWQRYCGHSADVYFRSPQGPVRKLRDPQGPVRKLHNSRFRFRYISRRDGQTSDEQASANEAGGQAEGWFGEGRWEAACEEEDRIGQCPRRSERAARRRGQTARGGACGDSAGPCRAAPTTPRPAFRNRSRAITSST